jgi:hypothetical protein
MLLCCASAAYGSPWEVKMNGKWACRSGPKTLHVDCCKRDPKTGHVERAPCKVESNVCDNVIDPDSQACARYAMRDPDIINDCPAVPTPRERALGLSPCGEYAASTFAPQGEALAMSLARRDEMEKAQAAAAEAAIRDGSAPGVKERALEKCLQERGQASPSRDYAHDPILMNGITDDKYPAGSPDRLEVECNGRTYICLTNFRSGIGCSDATPIKTAPAGTADAGEGQTRSVVGTSHFKDCDIDHESPAFRRDMLFLAVAHALSGEMLVNMFLGRWGCLP